MDRALRLQYRTGVAHQLQQAMLTSLPEVPGLEMAARYHPADSREHVGGDWYDAAFIPDPQGPGDEILAVCVGDVVGHTLRAATLMGQVRAMLRQAGWDRPGEPPSHALTALELATTGLGLAATGTAVLAHLRRTVAGQWSVTWSNAGHPPPVLLCPDGSTMLLKRATTSCSATRSCAPGRAATTTRSSNRAARCSSTPTASSSAAAATSTSTSTGCGSSSPGCAAGHLRRRSTRPSRSWPRRPGTTWSRSRSI